MKKIMIVDDEPDFCYIMKQNLEGERSDLEVHTCSENSQVLEEVQSFEPDLLILDIMMPGLSGPDVLDKIREMPDYKHTPVIFLTAVATPEDLQSKGPVVGGRYVVAKPIEIRKLLSLVDKLVI